MCPAGSTDRLQEKIGHVFAQRHFLQQALTHRSFGQPNNERLEFLGDSILDAVVSMMLFERFPALHEGELTRLRASLVCQDALHRLAQNLSLGDCLRLGEGELKSGGAHRPSILADAFEAMLAAVFLDAGFSVVKTVIEHLYMPLLAEIDPKAPGKDAKTALQEWLQGRRLALPTYVVTQVLGQAHAQEFEVACEIENPHIRTVARGTSRRAAEQASAMLALQQLKKT